MENCQPFIHKFKTEHNNYIYDVNTNQIIDVDDIVYEIIAYCNILPPLEIIERFKGKYDINAIQERINSIKQAKADGLFSEFRPQIIGYPRDKAEIKSGLDSGMSMLTLEVTQECNLRCKYCVFSDKYYYARNHRPKFMSFDIAQKAIDYYLLHSSEDKASISFYGGEPLLHFELIRDCVEYVNQRVGETNTFYSITTNGTFLNDRVVEFLREKNIKILVSLDGYKEAHDRNRVYKNGRGSYDTIMGYLRMMEERYPEYYRTSVNFTAVISPPYDYVKCDQFFSSANELKGHMIRFSPVSDLNTFYFDDFNELELQNANGAKQVVEKYISAHTGENLKNDSFTQELALARFLAGELMLKSIYTRSLHRLPAKWHPGGICIPGVHRCFVTAEGRFYPCERCNSNSSALYLGNVESGIELGRVLKIMERAKALFQEDCSNCWACRLCQMCYTFMEENNELSLEQKRKYCENLKTSLHQLLIFFCHILEKNPNAFDKWKSDFMEA